MMIHPDIQKKYFARAQFWANVLGRCPGVKAVFLSGSLARGDGNDLSDIDFFVIAYSGQIWTARFWVFVVLKICNRLAKPDHHAGQICPNHFITDQNLEIQEQDLYAAKLFSANRPLYDPANVWSCFVNVNRDWINELGCVFVENNSLDCQISRISKINHLHWVERQFESFIKMFQIKKIRSNPDYKKTNAKIVLTDTELRFHPQPKNQFLSVEAVV